jgi:CRP/FNR family cyclic AMP-dependent transcriptional regulator
LTYGSYGPGDYVGEMGLDGGPRSASVIAVEASVCAVVTRRTLEAHIAEQPAFAFELLTKVIRRARAATLTARQLALNDVYGRLRALITTLPTQVRPDGSIHCVERLTHLREAAAASERAARLATLRYEGGIADFLQVLDAERTLLAAQDQLAQAETQGADAYVALFEARGGDVAPAR